MAEFVIEFRIKIRLKNVLEHGKLGFFLRFERARIVKHLAVAVAENVSGKPSVQSKQTRLEAGGQNRLHQRLPGFEIFTADGRFILPGEFVHYR